MPQSEETFWYEELNVKYKSSGVQSILDVAMCSWYGADKRSVKFVK